MFWRWNTRESINGRWRAAVVLLVPRSHVEPKAAAARWLQIVTTTTQLGCRWPMASGWTGLGCCWCGRGAKLRKALTICDWVLPWWRLAKSSAALPGFKWVGSAEAILNLMDESDGSWTKVWGEDARKVSCRGSGGDDEMGVRGAALAGLTTKREICRWKAD